MELKMIQTFVLFVSIGLMVSQLFVKNKQLVHILFAVFSGSVAMLLAKQLSGNVLGSYQYLIGMGACLTCNGYWLMSRAMFRNSNSIATPHILLAVTISALVIINQGVLFVGEQVIISDVTRHILTELIVLLSSAILVLTCWEGIRGYSTATKKDKAQRLVFVMTIVSAIAISKVTKGLYTDEPDTLQMVITAIIFVVLINTQIIISWRFNRNQELSANSAARPVNEPIVEVKNSTISQVEQSFLARQIKAIVIEQSMFLRPNLKVADLARELDVPEYRVSNALRYNLNAKNFNQYINELRIKYAQTILRDNTKQHWSVLVVSLESGFASVGPFTRAFKAMTGYTPNQYRQHFSQTQEVVR